MNLKQQYPHSQHLHDFHQTLKNATHIDEVNIALRAILKQYNISMFTYTFYSLNPHSKEKIKYDACSENYIGWHQHYLAEHYDEIDTTHNTVNKNSLPVFWDLREQVKSAKTQKEKQMRLDSIKFGVIKGLSIPLHGIHEDYANFLVAQNKNETCLEKWEEIQYDIFIIAHYYHSYIQKFIFEDPDSFNESCLSQREMQCLLLTAKQCSVEYIANELNISVRTVNFHLQNINKKLGTRNKHQSVALAIEKGILTL